MMADVSPTQRVAQPSSMFPPHLLTWVRGAKPSLGLWLCMLHSSLSFDLCHVIANVLCNDQVVVPFVVRACLLLKPITWASMFHPPPKKKMPIAFPSPPPPPPRPQKKAIEEGGG